MLHLSRKNKTTEHYNRSKNVFIFFAPPLGVFIEAAAFQTIGLAIGSATL